jgi:hypothetical protein
MQYSVLASRFGLAVTQQRARSSGQIFSTSGPLSHKSLNSLGAHCSGSFALYRNTGPNDLLIGTSSGKLMRSVMCGTPVIASSFDSLRFVSQEGIGVQVCHPSEIPATIQKLAGNERGIPREMSFFCYARSYARTTELGSPRDRAKG